MIEPPMDLGLRNTIMFEETISGLYMKTADRRKGEQTLHMVFRTAKRPSPLGFDKKKITSSKVILLLGQWEARGLSTAKLCCRAVT